MGYPETKEVEIPEEIVEKWQNLVNIMADIIDVPAGLIMRIDPPHIEVFRSSDSEGNPYEVGDTEHLAGLYCEKVVQTKNKLLVPNAEKDDEWKDNPDVSLGMISYLGFPLEWPDGDVFGTICVLDSKENDYEKKYEDLMKEFRDIANSHLKLIYQRNELEREIQERKQVEERQEFLHSLLRHDVGNKNQTIRGYLELMKDYDLPDEVKEFVDKAESVAKDNADMIEKVRKLREIEQEEEIDEKDVSSVIDKVLPEHKDQLQEEGINIDIAECDCNVRGGPLLKELFSNLVENSIQHSESNEIKIHSQKKEGECIVTVEDDGVGISDEKKDKIFDKGFKAGESSGTGLGLYMVKEIVESYGGSVEVKDSEMGGARFDIKLIKENNL